MATAAEAEEAMLQPDQYEIITVKDRGLNDEQFEAWCESMLPKEIDNLSRNLVRLVCRRIKSAA